ncbi:MAG: hypothetical protein KY475_08010 [Planctomycetes bacterium]|nr:hypothetical protein [Planctomycetota bacterium]
MESAALRRARTHRSRGPGRPPGSRLDKHEDEIRQLLGMGLSRKQIAERLGCSEALVGMWIKKARKRWSLERPNFGLVKP